MSVMAETPPRPLETLSDSDMNIDSTKVSSTSKRGVDRRDMVESNGSNESVARCLKRKTEPPPSSPSQQERQGSSRAASKQEDEACEMSKNVDEAGQLNVDATPAAKKLKLESSTPDLPSVSPQVAKTSLVQLKNGKLTLKQKPVEWSRSMSALQAILAFNQWLDEEVQDTGALDAIPDAHIGMIAMLAQESDKALNDLAKHIKNVISPAADLDDEDSDNERPAIDRIPLNVIASAIERVAERTNYGLDGMASSSSSEASIPAGLQIWRWEVRDTNMLACESRDKIMARREERKRACSEAVELLAAMPEGERKALLSKGRKIKPMLLSSGQKDQGHLEEILRPQMTHVPSRPAVTDADDDVFMTPTRPKTQNKDAALASAAQIKVDGTSPAKSNTSRDSPRPSSKTVSPEQESRSIEKEEKRLEREAKRAEKARKEAEKEAKKLKAAQAQKRAASFMSSFVQRPRSASPTKLNNVHAQSDFDRVFPPCNYKEMAPINRFSRGLNGEITESWSNEQSLTKEMLLSDLRRSTRCSTSSSKEGRKGIHPQINVRECMRQITEAGVMGDEAEGRRVLTKLADRERIPIKLLHFHTDRRPAWFGTWTRATNLIGARRPLGQDPVALDYTYDSDGEWEEIDPCAGDDVQDNDKDDDDNESNRHSDSDSEMDDWLVDDLEVEEEEDDEDHPALKDPNFRGLGAPLAMSGRVNEMQPKKKAKKYKPIGRRFESKLVKFETGPHWEVDLGMATYSPFQEYQMEMLNEAYIGLDPFTFTTQVNIPNESNKALAPTASGPLPDASVKATPSSTEGEVVQAAIVDRADAFPEAHLGELLRAIEGSTSIRSVLLEELKQKFGGLGKSATKANMDACLHKYAEPKSKKAGSRWTIKQEYRVSRGGPTYSASPQQA